MLNEEKNKELICKISGAPHVIGDMIGTGGAGAVGGGLGGLLLGLLLSKGKRADYKYAAGKLGAMLGAGGGAVIQIGLG